MRAFSLKSLLKQYGPLFLALILLGLSGQAARANSGWKDLQGHSACGGIDKNGKLQEPCDYTRATKIGKALGKCPSGSFFDIGTWSCFSCPTGFNRNGRAVTSPKACDKPVTPKTSSAKFEKKVQCPAGSVLDPRNGGECWKCPSGYGRTSAGVDKWNACGMIGKKAVSAEFKGKACPDGSFRDPRKGGECWSCPEDYSRTADAVTSTKACRITLDFEPAIKAAALTCEAGEIFDFVDGGSCWKCDVGETRTWFGIKSAKACRNQTMKWVVPTRGQYGLFGLGKGADDILAKLIAERTDIDKVVKITAEVAGTDEAAALKSAWSVIDTKPWESSYLAVLLQGAVMRAAAKPAGQRTDSEKSLISTVSSLIQWNRQFIAYQARQAHGTWVKASELAFAEATAKMGAASIYADSMVTPPDYNELVTSTIQASAAIGGPAGALLMTMFVKPVQIVMLPFRTAARKAAIEAGKEGIKALAGSGGISSGTAAAAAAGPLIIAAAAAVIVTMEMDKFAKLKEAEGKIRQSIDIANRPVDIGLLLQQKNGEEEFKFHWASVIGAATQPSVNFKTRLAAYKAGKDPDAGTPGPSLTFPKISMSSSADVTTTSTSASTAATSAAGLGSGWIHIPGAANDIARGAGGTTYMVSTEKLAKGFKIYQRAKTASIWTPISGAATRIAVEGDQAWIVNSDGNVFSRLGNGWQPLRSPVAQDIGASAKGVWIVGVDGRIYQRRGKGWATIPGRARRIDVDDFGRPWVVDDQGSVAVRDNNGNWQTLSLSAVDVAIDLPGRAYSAGKDGMIYGRDTKTGKWSGLSQKGGDIVAVAAGDGQVWSVNAANEIFRLK